MTESAIIETKEQYERAKPRRLPLGLGLVAISPDDHEALIETIEALRRFARAHTKLDHARIGAVESLSHDDYNALVIEFRSARDALPDWLTDD